MIKMFLHVIYIYHLNLFPTKLCCKIRQGYLEAGETLKRMCFYELRDNREGKGTGLIKVTVTRLQSPVILISPNDFISSIPASSSSPSGLSNSAELSQSVHILMVPTLQHTQILLPFVTTSTCFRVHDRHHSVNERPRAAKVNES